MIRWLPSGDPSFTITISMSLNVCANRESRHRRMNASVLYTGTHTLTLGTGRIMSYQAWRAERHTPPDGVDGNEGKQPSRLLEPYLRPGRVLRGNPRPARWLTAATETA